MLTFNNKGHLSGARTEVPILHKEVPSDESGVGLSKVAQSVLQPYTAASFRAVDLSEE